jgi:hypothetical protein
MCVVVTAVGTMFYCVFEGVEPIAAGSETRPRLRVGTGMVLELKTMLPPTWFTPGSNFWQCTFARVA